MNTITNSIIALLISVMPMSTAQPIQTVSTVDGPTYNNFSYTTCKKYEFKDGFSFDWSYDSNDNIIVLIVDGLLPSDRVELNNNESAYTLTEVTALFDVNEDVRKFMISNIKNDDEITCKIIRGDGSTIESDAFNIHP